MTGMTRVSGDTWVYGSDTFEGAVAVYNQEREDRKRKVKKDMTPCPLCGHSKHGGTDARQIGRFTFPTPKHRADYDGAPLRDTREEALQDYCKWQQGRNQE